MCYPLLFVLLSNSPHTPLSLDQSAVVWGEYDHFTLHSRSRVLSQKYKLKTIMYSACQVREVILDIPGPWTHLVIYTHTNFILCLSCDTGISLVSEALRIAEDLQLQEDIRGTHDRLQQLHRLRLRGVESGRMPREIPVGRTARNQRFREPQVEILEGYLHELSRVSQSQTYYQAQQPL